jgi:hypothetical protein
MRGLRWFARLHDHATTTGVDLIGHGDAVAELRSRLLLRAFVGVNAGDLRLHFRGINEHIIAHAEGAAGHATGEATIVVQIAEFGVFAVGNRANHPLHGEAGFIGGGFTVNLNGFEML